MANDFIMDILKDTIQGLLDEFRADGLSDSEIIEKFSEQKIENALSKATQAVSSGAVDTMKSTMHERVLEECSNTL